MLLTSFDLLTPDGHVQLLVPRLVTQADHGTTIARTGTAANVDDRDVNLGAGLFANLVRHLSEQAGAGHHGQHDRY